jgi:cardiolipin synthase
MLDTAKKIFTIPNMISFFRILLIPVFAWAYLKDYMIFALVIIVLSGVSDTVDGRIARKYNMISDFGKMLDPIADKLTQMVLAVLMFLRFHGSDNEWMRAFAWVFLLFIAKEVLLLLFALVVLLMGKRPMAAEIWGKAATVAFYVVMAILFLAGPDVGVITQRVEWFVLPPWAVQILVILNVALTFAAFISYIPDTARMILNKEKKPETAE